MTAKKREEDERKKALRASVLLDEASFELLHNLSFVLLVLVYGHVSYLLLGEDW